MRVTKQQIIAWQSAGVNSIVIQSGLSSTAAGTQNVKLTANQSLAVKLGLRVKLNGEF